MQKDFYEILGIDRDASSKKIKLAYKRLARKYHPDVNPNDRDSELLFKQISEAYAVLSDPARRDHYDQFGPNGGFSESGGEQAYASSDVYTFTGFDFSQPRKKGRLGIGDIFSDIFGRKKKQYYGVQHKKGADIHYPMDIGFEDSMKGLSARIPVQKRRYCGSCKGSGYDPGGTYKECPDCAGSGTMRVSKGPLQFTRHCRKCAGSGKLPVTMCKSCGGKGFDVKMEQLAVKIPAGVDTGSKIRIPGKGEQGIQGQHPGDLYIITRVSPHPVFKRVGNNLTYDLPLTYPEAALGAKIKVLTLEGNTYLTIPAGTQNGQIFRLRGKGAPILKGGGRGDLLIKVNIQVPQNLDSRSKNLLQEFARLNNDDPRKDFKYTKANMK